MHEQMLTGKQVLITGATNGIGLAAAEALAARGANVALVGRNDVRTKNAAARVRTAAAPGAMVGTFVADLSSQASVRTLAAEALARYGKLDVLINNAGAMYTTRQLSVDDIELTWAVNHLSTFLLTELLLDRLKASAPSRIITTASDAHHGATIPFDDLNAERSYSGFGRYRASKLANILFTSELARRLAESGVTAHCFHPGLVASGFNRNNGFLMDVAMLLLRPISRSAEKGAETLVWLAASPEAVGVNGGYYVDMEWRPPSPEGQDIAAARRLWEISEAQCGPVRGGLKGRS
jgi:NAD(P)-dependent dehydrogenase (short-subunit alcohol dehydrogenase family)